MLKHFKQLSLPALGSPSGFYLPESGEHYFYETENWMPARCLSVRTLRLRDNSDAGKKSQMPEMRQDYIPAHTEEKIMAYATDRRASSPKRDNDVMKTQWPAITKTAYSEAFAKADEMDPKLRTLCQARLKMGQAMLALGRAMRSYKPCNSGDGRTGAVYNELRKIDEQLNKVFLKFPLELK